MKRTIARYVRVSMKGERDFDKTLTQAIQLDAIDEHLDRRGHSGGPVFEDLNESGTSFDRPAYIRACAWIAEDPERRGIATYDISRLGRSNETITEMGRLRTSGAVVEFANGGMSDEMLGSVEGYFMEGISALMADVESRKIGKRWRDTHTQRIKQGKYIGHPPLGYRSDKELGLSSDPVLGPVLVALFDGYADGATMLSLARMVGDMTGSRVQGHNLKRNLSSEVYLGRIKWRGEWHPSIHEPLVSEETFARVQRRLAQDAASPSRRDEPHSYLSGIVRCGHCERSVTVVRANTSYPAFACAESRRGSRSEKGCQGFGTPRIKLIEGMFEKAMGLWCAGDHGDPHSHAPSDQGLLEARVASLEAEQAKAVGGRDRLSIQYAKGNMSDAAFEAAMPALEAEIAERASRLKELRSELVLAPADQEEVRQRVSTVLDAIETLSKTEARALFRDSLDAVNIIRMPGEKPYGSAPWHGGIEPVWHGSFTQEDLNRENA